MSKRKPARAASLQTRALRSIQASTFKATCLELMDEIARSRAEIVVTKHGKPLIKVGPADTPPPSPFGFLRNTVLGHNELVGPDAAEWQSATADPLENTSR